VFFDLTTHTTHTTHNTGDVSAEEVNLFQYITRDDETDEGDERRASVAGDDKQRRVSVAKPAPGASLTQKVPSCLRPSI
jgi:hypothetical protein